MDNLKQHAQQLHDLSDKSLGKVVVAIGGGGSLVQSLTEWSNIFVALGNAALVAGGLYLMTRKIFNKRRDRREEDSL